MRESKSFTDQEALDKKLIEYIAPSEQDLFRQLSGKSFKRFNGGVVTLSLTDQPVRDYRMTLKQRILSYIMDPNVAFILRVAERPTSTKKVAWLTKDKWEIRGGEFSPMAGTSLSAPMSMPTKTFTCMIWPLASQPCWPPPKA